MNKALLFLGTMMFCLFPAVALSVTYVMDPYYNIALASSDALADEGELATVTFGDIEYDPYESGHNGYPILIATISIISGIPLTSIAFLPVGGVLIPFLYFAFAHKVFRSYYLALLFAIFAAFDPSLLAGHYSVFAYTWERALLLVFLIVLYGANERFNIGRRTLAVIVIFTGTFVIYWTTPILMIAILLMMNIMLRIDNARIEHARRITVLTSIALIIVYLEFSQLLYNEFVPAVWSDKYGTASDALEQLASWFSLGSQAQFEDYASSPSSGILATLILISRYVIIAVPIVIYAVVALFRSISVRGISFDCKSYVTWPVISAGLVQSAGYSLRGHISLRYISFLFAPIAVISMERLGYARIRAIPLTIVVLVSILSFPLFNSLDRSDAFDFSDAESSAEFSFASIHSDSSVLMDMDTYGTYLLIGVRQNDSFIVRFYDSERYTQLLGEKDSYEELDFDYVIINVVSSAEPISAPSWHSYEPIGNYLEDIDDKAHLIRVFDDGSIQVLAA